MTPETAFQKNKTFRIPGMIDVHVHLREPGGEHKETFATGTKAALAGGITAVLAMPNTFPPLTDEKTFSKALAIAEKNAFCDFALFLGATPDNWNISTVLHKKCAGLKIYVNDTYGPLRIESTEIIRKHMENWQGIGPIAFHAESEMMPIIAQMAYEEKTPAHFCHVSLAEEIEFIRFAKEKNWPVTCEVTPHHLFLDEDCITNLGTKGLMSPSLATKEDVQALWDNLDIIDCLATDHAPHTLEEKNRASPLPGVPGLETALHMIMTAVIDGRLSLEKMINMTHTRPREIYRLPSQPDTFVEVEISDSPLKLAENQWFSKCGWSPFSESETKIKGINTIFYKRKVYKNKKVAVRSAAGRNLRK